MASIASFQYEYSLMVDICCSRIVVNDDGGDLLGGFEFGREEIFFYGNGVITVTVDWLFTVTIFTTPH